MNVLAIDIGTSSLRCSIMREDGTVALALRRALPPMTSRTGVVEFDGNALAQGVIELATKAIVRAGPVIAVGIACQRASVILVERSSFTPLGPGIGWQDLRTVGRCMVLGSSFGLHLSPNQSATKIEALLDSYDPRRERSNEIACVTVDGFIAGVLSNANLHVTDASNAAVTGLVLPDGSDYDPTILERLNISRSILPTIVDSLGICGQATQLPGSPPIAGLIGDQQSSLLGQGCLLPGQAKATFGTGAMLDCTTGLERPQFDTSGPQGCIPIVAWQDNGRRHWGVEAIDLSAGSAIDWLVSGIGLVENISDTDEIAASVPDSAGVTFVPALSGLGTPVWDFGARGTLSGISASTRTAHIVRAVLEGIAHRGADLVEAAEHDSGLEINTLRVDGGMSANPTFVQALANATGKPIELANSIEATSTGAAFLAGTAVGVWSGLQQACELIPPRATIEPNRRLDRSRWLETRAKAGNCVPILSALKF